MYAHTNMRNTYLIAYGEDKGKHIEDNSERVENNPRNRLHNAILTLNFLNTNEKETTATERH